MDDASSSCGRTKVKLVCRHYLACFVGFDVSMLVFLRRLRICRLHVLPK